MNQAREKNLEIITREVNKRLSAQLEKAEKEQFTEMFDKLDKSGRQMVKLFCREKLHALVSSEVSKRWSSFFDLYSEELEELKSKIEACEVLYDQIRSGNGAGKTRSDN